MSRCRDGRHTHDFAPRCAALPVREAGADSVGEILWSASSAFLRTHAFGQTGLSNGGAAIGTATTLQCDPNEQVDQRVREMNRKAASTTVSIRREWPLF